MGVEDFSPEELGLKEDDPVPDLSLDPHDALLSVINSSQSLGAIYVYICVYMCIYVYYVIMYMNVSVPGPRCRSPVPYS